MKLSRESALILAICALDLVTTIWFVKGHGAQEANPLMRIFLEQGLVAFILAKGAFCIGPVALIEWARRQHPIFVRTALRTGIALYLGFYAMVVWKINNQAHPGDVNYTPEEMAAIWNYASQPASPQQIAEYRGYIARQ